MAAPCAPWHCVRAPVRNSIRCRPFNGIVRSHLMSIEEIERERKRDNSRVFLFFFGVYLLIGAGVMIHTGEWFIGFPPLLDLAYILLGHSVVGVYVEAAIASLCGSAFIWAAFGKWEGDAI